MLDRSPFYKHAHASAGFLPCIMKEARTICHKHSRALLLPPPAEIRKSKYKAHG